jgi:hypothetical protein
MITPSENLGGRTVETANLFEVVRKGDQVSFCSTPVNCRWFRWTVTLPRVMAFTLGLWLVAITDPQRELFDRAFKEITK